MKDVVEKNFCLQNDTNGNLKLAQSHQYYYQVQTQLGVSKLERAFFVAWTLKDIHVEQILLDNEFWSDICPFMYLRLQCYQKLWESFILRADHLKLNL